MLFLAHFSSPNRRLDLSRHIDSAGVEGTMVLTFIMLVKHEDSSIIEDSAQFPRHLKGFDTQRSVKGRKERRAEKSRKTTDARRWG
jgi:hypothetical protein